MDLFKKYDKVVTFNIRLISTTGQRAFSIDIPTIEYKPTNYIDANKTRDIYFRPNSTKFLMIDLDNNPSNQTLTAIKKKGAFLIVQTSKGHFQAWFYYPNSKNWEEYTKTCKYLTSCYNGDLNSCKPKQVGRLIGYNNLKPNREKYKVKWIYKNTDLPILHLTKKEIEYLKKPILSQSSHSGDINKTKPQNNQDEDEDNRDPNNSSQEFDMSDWAFINEVLEKDPTKTRQDLINILKSVSKNGHLNRYIEHTIDNVIQYRQNR